MATYSKSVVLYIIDLNTAKERSETLREHFYPKGEEMLTSRLKEFYLFTAKRGNTKVLDLITWINRIQSKIRLIKASTRHRQNQDNVPAIGSKVTRLAV